IADPLFARVEHASFLLEEAEQFGDKQWVSARMIGDFPHEPRRRVRLAEYGEYTLHFGLCKRRQRDRAGVALTHQSIERRLDRLWGEKVARLTADAVQQLVQLALASGIG